MAIEQKLRLVQQSGDITTVTEGEWPLIDVVGLRKNDIVQVVNFLRSGCAGVECLVEPGDEEDLRNLLKQLEPSRFIIVEAQKGILKFGNGNYILMRAARSDSNG